jgi:GT2 family glycosyltransferase
METYMHPEIDQYLAENLPDSEERIPTPMDPDCEVCIVIPAYEEREYILIPLESLIYQNNTTPNRFEVIIVVNNPGPPSTASNQNHELFQKKWERYQQIVKNNRETLKLIKYINEESAALDIRLSPKEEEITRKIKDYRLKVFAIDKSSQRKTLPPGEANVGGARNRGVAEAVERFYKQLKKNGILAHTDADTWLEENYIRNLIQAFKENPRLVGLAGIDEDILDNPRDSKLMKELMNGYILGEYGMLVHQLFLSDNTNTSVFFIGSAMATRAFETAMVGGVPELAGGEDYALGKKMEAVGLTIKDANVVTFPVIRLSPRTTTGKGHLMLKYGADEQKNGVVKVRSIKAAYFLGEIYKKLKEAKKNQQISNQDLRKTLVINNKPILDDEDLTRLRQNLHQLQSYRPELLNKELKEIIEKICDKIDDKYKPQPIDKAWVELISFFCINEKIKKKFQKTRTKMFQERKKDIKTCEYILEKIFLEKRQNHDNHITVERILSFLENSETNLLKKKYRLKRVAALIAASKSKEEALELIELNYMKELVLPGQDPVTSIYFELQALNRTLEEEIE